MNITFSLGLLGRFAAGEVGLDSLQNAVAATLRAAPDGLPALLTELQTGLEQGLISTDVYQLLATKAIHAARADADASHRPTGTASDATVLRARQSAPRAGSQEGTVLRPRPEAARDRASAVTPAGSATPRVQRVNARTDAELDDPHNWTGVWGASLQVGDVLSDRYRLEQLLGRGGMGEVYLAHDQVEDERFAIKVLSQDFRQHPEAIRALREEVRKSRDLAHPNIVSVYMLNRDGTHAYMVMEYLEGKPLDRLLAEDYARGMPLPQALPIIRAAGKALAYAHDRGVIHSDLKPSNIYVLAGGNAKVLDFGIARAVRGPRAGRFDARELGALTPEYASPEMLAGDQTPDVRDDVYGLACVAYELITGRHPFGGESAQEAMARRGVNGKPDQAVGLTRSQIQAFAKALAFQRNQRTASVEAFLAELEGGSLRGFETSLRRPVSLAAISIVLLAVGIGLVVLMRGPSEAEAFRDEFARSLPPAAEAADPDEVETLVELGQYYLSEAEQRFDSARLSRGVSSAYGSFRKALELDPSRPEALDGVVRVFKAYLERAETMAGEGQWPAAREAARYGLEIYPDSKRLKAILADAETHLADGQ